MGRFRLLCLLLVLPCLAGCSGGSALVNEIRAHSEDATIRAQVALKDNPDLVNYRGEQGRTPLHEAADYCNPTICALLLEKGADPDAVDELGNTPLHLAASPVLISDYMAKDNPSFIVVKRLYEDQRGVVTKLTKVTDQSIKNKAGKTWEDVMRADFEELTEPE